MPNTPPQPTAVGSLDKTPFCHLLLFCQERELTGTLCLWHPDSPRGGLGDAQICVERGVVLAACTSEAIPGQDLLSALVPIACWPKGVFAFHEARRLLSEQGHVVSGHAPPQAALASALRGHYRNDVVNAALTPLADKRLQLKSGVNVDAFQFTREELSLVRYLATHPSTIKELIGRGRPSPTTIRRLLYALRITRALGVMPAEQRQHSGTVEVPQTPELVHPRVPMPTTPTPIAGATRSANDRARSSQTVVSHRAPAPRPRARLSSRPVSERQAPEQLSPELTRRWQQIVARRASISRESFFEMLGLTPDATVKDASDAFTNCTRLWHPNTLPAPLSSLRNDVSAIYSQLREAHATLSNATRRAEYLAVLAAEDTRRAAASSVPHRRASEPANALKGSERAEDAARAHHAAMQCVQRRDFTNAVELLQRAVTLAPQEAEFGAALAFTRFELADRRHAATVDTIGMLESAIAQDPSCERAHHFLGIVLKQIGDVRPAMHHFEMAATLNPNNLEATRELRLYTMRKRTSEPAGLLGKLMNSIAPPRKTGNG